MRIMTWNLWWRYGPWQQRRDAIAAEFAAVAPDVCGLQEVWGTAGANLAAELADRLGMHWCWAPAVQARDGAGEEAELGNAVLSRWPIATHGHESLPTAEVDEPRVAVCARIDAPGGVLPMFTTHLTYRPGGSQVRMPQVRRLAQFVHEKGEGGGYPPVVTGDLNAEPQSDELRVLGGLLTPPSFPNLVLLDAWRYADPGDPGFTWSRANGYQADTPIPDSRIDYILTGLPTEAPRGRVRTARLAGTAPVDGVWPSDHFAVVADMEE